MRLRVYSTEIRMADNRAVMQEGSVHAQSAQAITTISRREPACEHGRISSFCSTQKQEIRLCSQIVSLC